MALKIYYQEDVLNILRAVAMAGNGTAAFVFQQTAKLSQEDQRLAGEAIDEHLRSYGQGYHDALVAAASAFGIISAYMLELDGERLKFDNVPGYRYCSK